MATSVDLSAYRHATWGGPQGSDYVAFLGEDLTSSSFTWSFAREPGGAIEIALRDAEPGMEGVSAAYDGGYLHPVSGVVVGATLLTPQIDRMSLRELLQTGSSRDNITLVHTLYMTRPDGHVQAQFSGKFTIMQGAPN